ncbi:MAG: phosphate ABC transporter substrate-binding protein PstS [Sulfuriferula sp.]|nr:phosphate ABC transporter substrate-binding protein PstS [Sulfuriferula sp.]
MQANFIKTLSVAAVTLTLGFSATAQATEITGAGSTWVYPLISKWGVPYAQATNVQVNYQAIGSGGGIKQIKAGTVNFGASDMPLKPQDLKAANLIQFPTAIAGEDMIVNLPGIKPGQLILSGPVIAKIYMGEISKWNDPAIVSLNKGLKLPDMPITAVHRSDGSGTTFTFASYLAKVDPTWEAKVGVDTAVNWIGGIGGKGNDGVAAMVNQVKGAIGYVEYAYILESKLNYVRMYNAAGKLVSPSLQGFQAAAANVDFTKAEDFYVILTNQPGAASWPISGCTWQILKKDAPKENNEAVVKFFTWGFEHGQDLAKSIAFGPLPTSTISAIKTYWHQQIGI